MGTNKKIKLKNKKETKTELHHMLKPPQIPTSTNILFRGITVH